MTRYRELGEVSARVLDMATDRAVTFYDVACELRLSRRHASVTMYNLAARGHLEEVERRPVSGARKPVPAYRAAVEAAPAAPTILLLDWPRR